MFGKKLKPHTIFYVNISFEKESVMNSACSFAAIAWTEIPNSKALQV